MADGNLVVRRERAFGQVSQVGGVAFLEVFRSPYRGLEGVPIEILSAFQPGTDTIVIAPHDQGRRAQGSQPLQNPVG